MVEKISFSNNFAYVYDFENKTFQQFDLNIISVNWLSDSLYYMLLNYRNFEISLEGNDIIYLTLEKIYNVPLKTRTVELVFDQKRYLRIRAKCLDDLLNLVVFSTKQLQQLKNPIQLIDYKHIENNNYFKIQGNSEERREILNKILGNKIESNSTGQFLEKMLYIMLSTDTFF